MTKIMARPKYWRDDASIAAEMEDGIIKENALDIRVNRKNMKSGRPKTTPLRDSASGEICTLQIAGVCNGRTDTTVLCHLPFIVPAGMGQKTIDLCSCYGCSECHSCIDGRAGPDLPITEKLYYATRALVRTLTLMVEKGLITAKGVK